MSNLEALFSSTTPVAGRQQMVELIKEWVRAHLSIDAEKTIMVRQVECRDPACPGIETIIALLESHRIQRFKFPKPIKEVEESDLIEAIRSGDFTVKTYPSPH